MKKLLLFLLVLAGGVSTASAASTTTRIYAKNEVSWGNMYIYANYWKSSIEQNIEVLASTKMTPISGTSYYYVDVTFNNDLVDDAMSESNYGIKFQFHNGSDWTAENQIKDESFLTKNSIFYIYNKDGLKNSREDFTYYFAKALANSKIGDAVELTPDNNFLTAIVDNESSITEAWYVLYPSFAEKDGSIQDWNLTIRPKTDSGNYDVVSFINYKNGRLQHGNANGVYYVNSIKAKNTFSFDLTNMSFTISPSFSRTISAVSTEGYATFSSPYDVKIPAELTAYYGKTVNGAGAVVMAPIENANNEVYHGDGILLKGTAGNTYEFTPAENSPSTISGNLLVGVPSTNTTVPTSNEDDYYYVYGKDDAGLGFYKVTSDITCPAGNAYLHTTTALATPSGARVAMVFDENESTGINTVKSINSNMDSYYTLQGHRVAKPTKGLYIVNGKKYVK